MKFSIVVPLYNSEMWIRTCVESVLNQSYKNFELIIVDDMSSDSSYEIVRNIKANSKYQDKIRIFQNTTKRLNGGTRNVGISQATGEYIINIDSDDYLKDENVLKRINEHIKENNYPDVVFTGYEMITESGISSKILDIKDNIDLIYNQFGAAWLKVVKTELYKKYPFPEGTIFEDRIQNYSMIRGIKKFTCLKETTHCWNRLNENATTFNPKWCWYRFEYCGELYRLIHEVPEGQLKSALIEELNLYMSSIKEMVNEL